MPGTDRCPAMQLPDVSDTQITFTFGDDIWGVPKQGGVVQRLTSPAGSEMYPRFSPDGKQIAFSANYNGNYDAYVKPTAGGVPTRLTYHGMPDYVQGWTPEGESVLFTSGRESGKERFSQFYTIASGESKRVEIQIISDQKAMIPKIVKTEPDLMAASISPDGNRVIANARGEIFNLPAKKGFVTNLTNTSGVAEHYPEIAPDGKK
ncbi:hypothetical protein [Algoriphagus aquimarinus]|uniref:hypothetical protein n=1 Tax=Algoriphagus aquimarinus TaxID=237018 RepID=UPI0030DB2A2F